jgi:hypothetical protein
VGTGDVIDLVGGSAAFLTLVGAGIAFVRTRLGLRRLRANIMGDGATSPAPTPEALAPYTRQVGRLEARTRNLAMLGAVAICGLGVTGLRRLMGPAPQGPGMVNATAGRSSRDRDRTPDAAPYKTPAWAHSTEAGVWQAGAWEGTALRAFPASASLCRQNCELRLHECAAATHDGTTCVLFRRVERFVAGKAAATKQAWRPAPPP